MEETTISSGKKKKKKNLVPLELANKKWLFYTSIGMACILFYVVLAHIEGVMQGFRTLGYFVYPVFLGLVIAYVLSPLVKIFQTNVFSWIRNPTINRNTSVLLTLVCIVLGLFLMLVGLVPPLWNSFRNLISNLGNYSASLQNALEDLREFAAGYGLDISEAVESARELVQSLTTLIGSNVDSIISTSFDVGKGVFNFLIAVILAIYLLCDKFPFQQNNHRLMKALINPGVYEKTVQFLSQCNAIMSRYILSEFLDALIVGLANAFFMAATNMPYISLTSLVVGLTNLAPTFGPIVGAIIGAVILLLVNPWDALWFLVFTSCLQAVDGYLIKPRLFGDMLGVSSVWILASIIIGGRMLGVLGILIAIPIAAILALLYKEYVLPILEKRREILNERAGKEKAESKGSPAGDGAEG